MSTISYNRIIRKLVVGFGNLFDSISVARYNPDGTEQERFVIPLVYAPKEIYVQRLEGDPSLDKKVQITLPRLSFELNGIEYDSTRKQNTNIRNFVQTPSGVLSQYNPVPYNFDFSLYAYVRNIEDGTQIIEHILPFFTPDYTIKLNLIPELGVIKEIPIVLNKTEYEVKYEGNRDMDTRMVIWTLNFTVKGFIFGAVTPTGLITTSITNILTSTTQGDMVILNMTGGTKNYKVGEVVYQGYSVSTATASATVVDWVPTTGQLTISGMSGNFVSSLAVIGLNSGAKYTFSSYQTPQKQDATIVVTPVPSNANATNVVSTLTTITEN